jgi:hypothetical protein
MDSITFYTTKIASLKREIAHLRQEGDKVAACRLIVELKNYNIMLKQFNERDEVQHGSNPLLT